MAKSGTVYYNYSVYCVLYTVYCILYIISIVYTVINYTVYRLLSKFSLSKQFSFLKQSKIVSRVPRKKLELPTQACLTKT